MSFKRLKRAVLCVAAAAAIGASAALAGCTIETSHPRAEITLEFNGTQYVIEYTLYRNMYPQTVRHFIELAEAGFYNNTIIHDYASNDWYGGGYTYDETAYADAFENGAFDDYLNDSRYYKEDDYLSLFNSGALTPSVYTDYSYDADGNMTVSEEDAYHTLIGEFENNDHIIDNGQRSAEYGSLKMYYTPKVIDNIAEAHVYIKTGSGQVLEHDYEYNSATSLFAIQVGTSSSLSVSRYATFGLLQKLFLVLFYHLPYLIAVGDDKCAARHSHGQAHNKFLHYTPFAQYNAPSRPLPAAQNTAQQPLKSSMGRRGPFMTVNFLLVI